MAETRHGTLAANTATTVSLSGNYDELLLCNRDGAAEIYYTIDGSTPTVGGNDCLVLPATIGWARMPSRSRATTTVQLVANNPVKYTIRSIDPFGSTTSTDTALTAANQAVTATTPSAWFSADTIVDAADNQPASTWVGVANSGHVGTQPLPASQPLYKTNALNGRPVLRFDGVDDYFRVDTLASVFSGDDLPFSVCVVSKVTTVAAAGTFVSGGRTSTSAPYCSVQSDSTSGGRWFLNRRDDSSVQATPGSGASSSDTSWHVHAVVCPGTTAGWWTDGANKIVAGSNFNVGQTTCDQAGIGAMVRQSVGSGFLSGDIAELIVWNRALSTTERQNVERALGTKYGITVV